MLRQLDQDIWVAEQPLKYMGLSVGTRMTVVRLLDKTLALISPIRASDKLVDQLNKLGSVQHIIAPNLYHYLFVSEFKQRYPQATLWAVPGLKDKQPSLPIDATIQSESSWNGLEHIFFDGFSTLGFSGVDALNECVFYHSPSKSLILTDTAFYFDESFPWLTQLTMRVLGSYKSLQPSLLEKIASTQKEQLVEAVKAVLKWDFERVVVAHGSVVETQAKQLFIQGYEQFLGLSLSYDTLR